MQIEIAHLAHDKATMVIKGAPLHLANSIRRIMIAEVPTLAIDRVFVAENTSSVFDEIIAHRLGLIPLSGDISKLRFPEECECNGTGCPGCEVRLFLDIEALEDNLTVYSGHLKSERADVYPISESIPIIVLAKGQRLVLEARARLGRGKMHAKWQPVSVAVLRHMPKITIFESCNNCEECIRACPRHVLYKGKNRPMIGELISCNLCKLCEEVCELKAIQVSYDTDTMVMQIESVGSRSVKEIVNEACDILERKMEDFIRSLKEGVMASAEVMSGG